MSELIDGVVEDAAAEWGSRYDLTIEWEFIAGDRLPEGQTVEGIIKDLGVTLPRTGKPLLTFRQIAAAIAAESEQAAQGRYRRKVGDLNNSDSGNDGTP